MKTYLKPELVLVQLSLEDVICSSIETDPAKKDIFDEAEFSA